LGAQSIRKLELGGRGGTIGGTSWGPLLGVCKYKNAMDIWSRVMGYEKRKPTTEVMARGIRLEPIVAELAEEALGLELYEFRSDGEYSETQRWPQPYPMFSASPDRLAFEPFLGGVERTAAPQERLVKRATMAKDWQLVGPVELKTMSERGKWEGAGPPSYRLQLMSYIWWAHLDALSLNRPPVGCGFLVCLQAKEESLGSIQTVNDARELLRLKAAKLHVHTYDRDPVFVEQVIPLVLEWWDRYVETKTPPPAVGVLNRDGVDTCAQALQAHFGYHEERAIDAGEELVRLAELREEVRTSIKALENDKRRIDNEIRMKLAGAKLAESPRVKISVSQTAGRMRFDAAALKAADPETHEKYMSRGASYEVMRVTLREPKEGAK